MSVAARADAPLILVADDVPANVELLHDQLGTLGFRTIGAFDGPQALALAAEHRPALAILDVAMPAGELGCEDRATGFEVCRRLKRDPRTARIPVVFVTALNDTTDRVKAIEAGGDDFLTKPHNRMVLGARIRALLALRTATDELEGSYRKLRELEKVRDDLMKMIVHDLKTPLAAVQATLEMLGDGDFGPVTATQAEALGGAQARAADLLALIEDLLELARLEEAHVQLERTPIEVAPFLAQVLTEWEHRLQQEGGRAYLDVAPGLPVVHADPALLRRVLNNLVQNAVVHARRAVTVTLAARADQGGVRISVTDDGPGIAPAYHELIFRKFERVRVAGVSTARSSGLGLSFCKLVADAHGGRIWVQSAEGAGATFHLYLPVGIAGRGASA
ncbi:MAG: hybrid sensor histidine kinase/response regulator [Gemmatimonadetes bacterium]|nr:hybrid sensor histidine kinase/response regulator [Gemmatimonadota bacterium]